MDINIKKSNFEDARPKIREVVVPIDFPKMLNYWRAIARWALILFAGLAPIFFLPFTALPVSVNKEILIFTLILAAFFALLGRVLIEGRIRYPGHLLTASLLVLTLVWGVSAFFSVNQIGSLVGSWSAPDSFLAMLLFVILALSIAMTFNRSDIVISLMVFLASLSVLGISELLQLMKVFALPFAFTKNAAFNPIGSVNDLGLLLAFGLILAAGLMSGADLPKLKKLLGVSIVILLINLIIIDFWAIWVGLALAMVFMISFLSAGLTVSNFSNEVETSDYQGLQLIYFRKAWLPSLIFLISLLLLFIPSPLSKFIQTPVEVSPTFRTTLDIGFSSLKSGNYLLGSGPGTFGYIYNLYKPEVINRTIFWLTNFNAGASAFASWVGTVGIFGNLALLFLILTFIWTGIKLSRLNLDRTIFVAVIFMFAMWFLYIVNFAGLAFTFWGFGLFLAVLHSYSKEGKSVFKELLIFTSAPKTFIFSLLVVALMVLSAAGVYFEVNRYIAEVYFAKADYDSAIQFWPYDERYYQNLAQTVFLKLNVILAKKNIPQDALRTEFQNITTNSIAFAQKASSLNPKNPFNAVLLGGIYENLIPFTGGASDFALSSYGKAVSLDPKNPVNYLALGRIYIARADLLVANKNKSEEISSELDKAVSNLERAIELKQDYAPARFLLVQVFDRQGKLPEAVKRAEELVMLNNADIGALFQLGFLYYKSGRFSDSKIVFERTVELSPNYSNARYFLGLIYDRESIGAAAEAAAAARARALEQFAKIAEFNPDNAEVKQIIANLVAKKPALFGIAPPALAPQNRAEAPVSEKAPVQKLKK